MFFFLAFGWGQFEPLSHHSNLKPSRELVRPHRICNCPFPRVEQVLVPVPGISSDILREFNRCSSPQLRPLFDEAIRFFLPTPTSLLPPSTHDCLALPSSCIQTKKTNRKERGDNLKGHWGGLESRRDFYSRVSVQWRENQTKLSHISEYSSFSGSSSDCPTLLNLLVSFPSEMSILSTHDNFRHYYHTREAPFTPWMLAAWPN